MCLFTRWRAPNQWGLVGVRACFCRVFPFLECFFFQKGSFYSLLFIISGALEVDELALACRDDTLNPFMPLSDLPSLPRVRQI